MKCPRVPLVVVAATSLLACSRGEGDDTTGFTRADSAGMTIAVNTLDAATLKPAFTVAAEPRLRIGAEAGVDEVMFNRVNGVVRLDDGRIAVGNSEPSEIRIFDTTGTFVTRLGRSGQGPGEFQYMSRMFAGGDTVFAVNVPPFQLFRFTASGGYLGMTTSARDSIAHLIPDRRRAEGTQEFLRNGSMLITTRSATSGPTDSEYVTGELHRVQSETMWISPDRSRALSLGAFGGIQQMPIDLGGGRRTFEIPPSARRTISAIGARGTRFCAAGNEVPEVRCIDQDGQRLIVRWVQDSILTSAADVEAWRASARASGANPRSSPQIAERIIAGIKVPPTVPPIRGVRVTTDGRLLISGPDLVGPEGLIRVRVFSRDGQLLGIADLPRAGGGEIGEDYLLGVTRNDDGVEFVAWYDVRRGG